MSAASRYEVKIPNGVAGIRGTVYDISVEGIIKCLVGSIYLRYMDAAGKEASQVIMGDQMFDIRTGVLQALPNLDRTAMIETVAALHRILAAAAPLVYTVDTTLYLVSPH